MAGPPGRVQSQKEKGEGRARTVEGRQRKGPGNPDVELYKEGQLGLGVEGSPAPYLG